MGISRLHWQDTNESKEIQYWKNKSKSSLIQPDEEADFNSRLENAFEEDETQNEWFKEEATQDEEMGDIPQVSLIGRSGEDSQGETCSKTWKETKEKQLKMRRWKIHHKYP